MFRHATSCLMLCLVAGVLAASAFEEGRAQYAAGDYEAAADAFRVAIEESGEVARYHHWLGKAYGRQAEQSGWTRAVRLAGKTRDALRRAVELDPDDVAALEDLADYYDSAPGFLGGNRQEARALRQRIAELQQSGAATAP
ncbi:MAG: hypothetical protein JJT85_01690 [Chromatiales bacterium]|nr:hypothetical protein [Chromatiales bacterium]